MMADPIADMLTRVRNAQKAGHELVDIPFSRIKTEIARLLKENGYIQGYEVLTELRHGTIRVSLRYVGEERGAIAGLKRASKPGRRIYIGSDEIRPVKGGVGMAVLSTTQGIMTNREAKKKKLGGELLCHVW